MYKSDELQFIVINIRKERDPFGKTYYTLKRSASQDACFEVEFYNTETVTKEMLREAAVKHYIQENVPQLIVQGDII